MISTFVPRLAISAWTDAVAPWPRLTIATTAPMPMMMPSMVSPARNGFRRRIRRADRMVSQRKDMCIGLSGLFSLSRWSDDLVCLVHSFVWFIWFEPGEPAQRDKPGKLNQPNKPGKLNQPNKPDKLNQ